MWHLTNDAFMCFLNVMNGLLAENTKLFRATNMEFLLLLSFAAVHVPHCGGSSWEIITERRLLQLLA
jgi:hypothetical protein